MPASFSALPPAWITMFSSRVRITALPPTALTLYSGAVPCKICETPEPPSCPETLPNKTPQTIAKGSPSATPPFLAPLSPIPFIGDTHGRAMAWMAKYDRGQKPTVEHLSGAGSRHHL